MKEKILVTGAGGQLGIELKRLVESSVVGRTADEQATGAAVGAGCYDWLLTDAAELDITDPREVEVFFAAGHPGVVVNCAAYTDVDRAETERDAAFRINRDGVRFLAETSREHGAVLIHISTDFVFDGRVNEPYTETDKPHPLNVYGESKLAGEQAVLSSGCRGAIVRTSWLYSPWGRNFVRSILATAAKNSEIKVVSDQFGCPTSAAGLAGAIVKMIQALVSGTGTDSAPRPAGIYNYCDAGITGRAGFAAEIIKQAGLACRVVPIPSAEYPAAAQRPAYSALDTTKLTRDFDIVPQKWQDRLKDCINVINDER